MTELYNKEIATHYAAFRPPLHQVILAKVLARGERFSAGLDVGCGTGYSTVALAEYSHAVLGIDPSLSMLDEALPHERITYSQGSGEEIPLSNDAVDVVTFAGSLFYAKSDALTSELRRVCRPEAVVIVYDFEILLDHFLRNWGISAPELEGGYDHELNFSGVAGFEEIIVGNEQVQVDASVEELAHVLLSDLYRYEAFVAFYGTRDPFRALINDLGRLGDSLSLRANVFFASYHLGVW